MSTDIASESRNGVPGQEPGARHSGGSEQLPSRAEPSSSGPHNARSYVAALVTTLPFGPIVACLVTLFIYASIAQKSPQDHMGLTWLVILGSLVLTSMLWILLAVILWHVGSTQPDQANLHIWGDLDRRLDEIRTRLIMAGGALEQSGPEHAALRDLWNRFNSIEDDRRKPSISWITGTGYVNLCGRLHRLQEDLLPFEPVPSIVRCGLRDELRLRNMSISNRDSLLELLAWSLCTLDASLELPWPTRAKQKDNSGEPPKTSQAPYGADRRQMAKIVLADVHRAVNEYRDGLADCLVRARNHIMRAIVFLGVTTYVVLGLALLAGATPNAVLGAAACYLVGAAIGLFGRVYRESTIDASVGQDFGVAEARVALTPLLSGVSAVAGVFLTLALAAGAGATLGTNATPPNPESIFLVGQHPFGLIVAGAFGLAPGLLVSSLQRQATQLGTELRDASSTGRKDPVAAS